MWLSPSGQVAHTTLDWRLCRTRIFTSAGLIESTSSTQQLKECIKDLWQLIDQYRLIQTEKELEITLECNQKDKK